MPEIFISYSHADRDRVRKLVERLRTVPFDIWWDQHLRQGDFSNEIEARIEASSRVLVAWSKNSANSIWVKAEAMRAMDSRKLVQVQLDGQKLPLPFNGLHAIRLSEWTGDPADDSIKVVIEALGGEQRTAPRRGWSAAAPGLSRAQRVALWLAPTCLVMLAAAAGFLALMPDLPDGLPDKAVIMLGIGIGVVAALGVSTASLILNALDAFRADAVPGPEILAPEKKD